MKFNILVTIISLMALSSCSKSYIQVLNIQGVNTSNKNGELIFENDSIRINYDFYANKGKMSFKILNKLNSPIYIDWKNSSFIYNGEKYNYWIDESNSIGKAVQRASSRKSNIGLTKQTNLEESFSILSQRTIKAERITFIPPKSTVNSNISYNQFKLTNAQYFKIDPKIAKKSTSSSVGKMNKKKALTTYEYLYNEENSIINFRNFLAISFNENSNAFKFIDNKFYVINLKEMDMKSYLEQNQQYKSTFYISNIQSNQSAKSRDDDKN